MKISFISKTNQVYKLNTKLDQCRHYLLHLKQSTGLIGLFKREVGLVVLAKFNFLSKKIQVNILYQELVKEKKKNSDRFELSNIVYSDAK